MNKSITGWLAYNIAVRNIYTTSSKKALLSTFLQNIDPKTGGFFKSMTDLQLESGCSESFIKKIITSWSSIGLISVKTGDMNRANEYTLNLEELQKQAQKCKALGKKVRESKKEKNRARQKRWYDNHNNLTPSEAVRPNATSALDLTPQPNVLTVKPNAPNGFQKPAMMPSSMILKHDVLPVGESEDEKRSETPEDCKTEYRTLPSNPSPLRDPLPTVAVYSTQPAPEPELTPRQKLEAELARARKSRDNWERNGDPALQVYLEKSRERVADLERELVAMDSNPPDTGRRAEYVQ